MNVLSVGSARKMADFAHDLRQILQGLAQLVRIKSHFSPRGRILFGRSGIPSRFASRILIQPLAGATKPALANVRKFRVITSRAVPRYLAIDSWVSFTSCSALAARSR